MIQFPAFLHVQRSATLISIAHGLLRSENLRWSSVQGLWPLSRQGFLAFGGFSCILVYIGATRIFAQIEQEFVVVLLRVHARLLRRIAITFGGAFLHEMVLNEAVLLACYGEPVLVKQILERCNPMDRPSYSPPGRLFIVVILQHLSFLVPGVVSLQMSAVLDVGFDAVDPLRKHLVSLHRQLLLIPRTPSQV